MGKNYQSQKHYPNSIFFFMLFAIATFTGCISWSELENHPKDSWFANLPSEYRVKHLATLEFADPKLGQMDLIAYLLVKGDDLRLVAMNELGITAFDIYAAADKEPVVVKSLDKIQDAEAIKHLVDDIRLTFLSASLFAKLEPSVDRDALGVDVLSARIANGDWCEWQIVQQYPQKITRYRSGVVANTIEYDYQDGEIRGFPRRISISYPTLSLSVQLKILDLREIPVSEEQIKP